MKTLYHTLIIFGITALSFNAIGQNTKQLSITNGDGWYRIISGTSSRGGGMVRIYGTSGNNRQTVITMNVSLMRFGQGGSINITDNVFYNSNHVDLIRGGSVNGQEFVLDVHLVGINNPTNLSVEVDGYSLPILDNPVFNPTPPDGNVIEISGRVIGVNSKRWPVYLDQKVGIGTAVIPNGYKLAVDGKAILEEVNVRLSENWPDFVFNTNYILPTLEQVETHIKENGHLKDIPSEAEVKENGINLGEMDAKLLQKIEELTLYTIAQQKLLNTQTEQLSKQKQSFEEQLSQQEKLIEKLIKRIETLENN